MTSWEHLQNTNSRITQKINHFRKSVSANSKTVESSQYDFYIEDSRIQIIENDNFTTYTFFVVRDSPLPNILENYTYKAYNDGTYEQFLLKYHYTTHENGELIFDTDILEIETLNDEGIIFNRSGCLPEFVEVLNDVVCTHNTVCTSPDQHEVGDICFCGTTDPTCEPAGSLSCEYEYIWTYQGCGGGNSIPDPNDPGNNTGSGSNNDNPGYVLTPGVPVEDPRPIWEPITSCINGLKAIGQTDNTTIDTEILSQLNLSIAEWGVINNYLEDNGCIEEAQEFTLLAIEALDNDGEVDFENKIILDSSFVNNTKLKCVWDKLTNDNNPLFRNTVGAFISDPQFNLTFRVGDCVQTDVACTDDNDPYNVVITIENISQNPIELTQTILHEAIHAELARFAEQYNTGLNINNRPQLFQFYTYYESLYGDNYPDEVDHIYMTMNYVNPISSALREFDNYSYTIDYYKSFAWDGIRRWDANNLLQMDPLGDEYDSYRSIVNLNSDVCN